MTVDDVFSIRGRGTVATGTIEAGALHVGDQVQINRADRVRVDGIEAFRKIHDHAEAGTNVGLLFSKLDRSQLAPGDLLTGLDDTTAVPTAAAAREVAAPPTGRDPRFGDAEVQRTQFLSMREAGLMNDAQIDEALRGMAFEFGGRRWMLRGDSDAWYASSDGADWKHETPPGERS